MPLTARIVTAQPLAGPAILDLLDALAAQPGDLTLLHSSDDSGPSVLAAEPVLTIEFDSAAQPCWIAHRDINPPPLPPATDPLIAWQHMLDAVTLIDDLQPSPPLVGWLGAISYDIGRHIERISHSLLAGAAWPLLRWTLFDAYFLFNPHAPVNARWTCATLDWNTPRPESARQRLDRLTAKLNAVSRIAPAAPPLNPSPAETPTLSPSLPSCAFHLTDALAPDAYRAQVTRIKNYIAAGDIYQANFAQRWTFTTSPILQSTFSEHHSSIYRRLCAATPAPYAAFLRFGRRAVLCASPELFLHRSGPHLITRPIKGTRPRDLCDPARDAALKSDLLASPKDHAELAMIVDLLRNDLGRICAFGSIKIADARQLEAHPTVWHTVATIHGQLLSHHEHDWAAIIRALCPGGSITGAPKIRAMQILDELEQAPRGWYCGHIGWIGARGSATLNIAIRTILLEDNLAHVWAGGGIVADSDEHTEYEETRAKARALFHALAVTV